MEKITNLPKLPKREPDSHKGSFGKVLVIAGSVGMSGAASITGKSALKSGAGLVKIATAKSVQQIVANFDPCYMTVPLAEDRRGKICGKAINNILQHIKQSDVVAFGPGVGTSGSLQSIASTLISQEGLRLVVDADGLNNLAKDSSWVDRKKASVILTPHPGEMKRLWKSLIREQMPDDRNVQAATLAERTECTVVLKGAATVVSDGNKIYVNKTGNPGMATAGAGDVLTGVIAALAGQGLSDFDAAVLGVYIHGLAGDIAAEWKGQTSLIATDITDALPDAFKRINA